jgi:hypothetical protein
VAPSGQGQKEEEDEDEAGRALCGLRWSCAWLRRALALCIGGGEGVFREKRTRWCAKIGTAGAGIGEPDGCTKGEYCSVRGWMRRLDSAGAT